MDVDTPYVRQGNILDGIQDVAIRSAVSRLQYRLLLLSVPNAGPPPRIWENPGPVLYIWPPARRRNFESQQSGSCRVRRRLRADETSQPKTTIHVCVGNTRTGMDRANDER